MGLATQNFSRGRPLAIGLRNASILNVNKNKTFLDTCTEILLIYYKKNIENVRCSVLSAQNFLLQVTHTKKN